MTKSEIKNKLKIQRNVKKPTKIDKSITKLLKLKGMIC